MRINWDSWCVPVAILSSLIAFWACMYFAVRPDYPAREPRNGPHVAWENINGERCLVIGGSGEVNIFIDPNKPTAEAE